MKRAIHSLLFALALVHCDAGASNAIVEIEFRVPARFDVGPRTMAFVAFAARRGTSRDFSESWSASATTPLGDVATTLVASVEATDRFEETLRVKVIYCESETCTDAPGTTAKWFEIEEPFRPGEFTAVAISSSATDPETSSTDPEVIGRCFVAGCGAVPPPSALTGYCDSSGTHPCDR